MLLAVDARNLGTSIGFREEGRWLAVRRFGPALDRGADEFALLMELSASRASPAGRVDRAVISSVVPASTPILAEAILRAFGVEALVVGPGTRTGVKLRTEFPQELGSDLVCAAAAAYEMAGGPCVVVDSGAALTLSAVGPRCEFLGAAIAPGISRAALSLKASAALIPEVKLDRPSRVIGKSTVQSIQAGVILGYQGLVERLVGLMLAELGEPGAAVIGTGDEYGREILAAAGYGVFAPDLVLEGLALIEARARA